MRALLLLLVTSCASGTPASASMSPTPPTPTETSAAPQTAASTPSPPPTASAASTSTPTPPPVPTGGSVLIGDINAPKGFNPKTTIVAMQQQLIGCFNQARASNPEIRGKVTLRISVNEAGAVNAVDAEPGGHANDPALVSCIESAMKQGAHFPKPGGTATILAPLVFRP